MANNDVRIKVSLDGDKQVASGLQGVGDSAGQADSKLGSLAKGGLAGAGKALVGLGVAAGVAGTALGVAVIGAYAEYEQNLGGIETMFKDSSAKMVEYADQAYMTAGLGANEYMSQVTSFSAALLQGLGGDTEAAADLANVAMVDMSDNANKFGTNITSIQDAYQGFAKQNYTMLDNLKLGYGGTASEMARLINDSGVMGDAIDVTAKTVNDVSYDKIIEALHSVQDEMGIAGTTAAEATETISGSVGMLKGAFDNLLVGLGSADADVATLAGNVITSLETVIGNVGPVIESLGSNMSALGPQLGTMMGSLVDVIAQAIPGLIGAGTGIIEGLVSGIATALPQLITAIVPALVGLVDMIATQLPLLVDAGMQALIALGQGLVQALPQLIPMVVEMITGIVSAIIDNLPMLLEVALDMLTALGQGLLEAIPVLIEALPEIITSLVDFLVGAIPQIIDAGMQLLMGIIGALPDIILGLVEAIPQIITALIEGILAAIPQLIEGGIQLFMALIEALPEIIVGIVGAIPQITTGIITALIKAIPQLIKAGVDLLVSLVKNIGPIVSSIVKAVPKIIKGIMNALDNSRSQLISAGGDLLRGIWEGISGAAGWLWDKVKGWASGLTDGIKDFFGINSPSLLFKYEIGQQLPAGLGEGIEVGAHVALDAMDDLGSQVLAEAGKLSNLRITPEVSLGMSPSPFTGSRSVPQAYVATPMSLAPQKVVLDTDSLQELLTQTAGTGLGQTTVDMPVSISMYDRDPRIVGKQLGRSVKGVLVG